MEFVFEVHTNEDLNIIKKEDIARLRRMVTIFELMVNTTLPEIRVHLRER